MTNNEILRADVLDILFDNRNKLYGAYVLRKTYASRLGTALVSAVGAVLLLLFFIRPGETARSFISPKPDVVVHAVDIPLHPPTPPVPPAPRIKPPAHIAENSYLSHIKMVDRPDPLKEMKDMAAITEVTIGTTNVEGPVASDIQVAPQPTAGNGDRPTTSEEKEPAFVPLEKQPEFPGGKAAWANFLNRNLRTPEDLGAGEKKVVQIRFMVDVNGSVTGFEVIQSGGAAFDNEVIRVLKKMPRWKPAVQNGHPVAVPFTQPVTFVGLEE